MYPLHLQWPFFAFIGHRMQFFESTAIQDICISCILIHSLAKDRIFQSRPTSQQRRLLSLTTKQASEVGFSVFLMLIFYLLEWNDEIQNVKQTITSLLMEKSESHSRNAASSSQCQKRFHGLRAAAAPLNPRRSGPDLFPSTMLMDNYA